MEDSKHKVTRLELLRKMRETLDKVSEFREVTKEELTKEFDKIKMQWEKLS